MKLLRSLGLGITVLVIAACGGGGGDTATGGGGGGGGGTGGTVAEATKISMATRMGNQMNTWRTLPKATRQSNLVAWAKTQPGVADAGIAPETQTVWVRFNDGDGTVYIDNRPGSKTPIGRETPVASKPDMPGDVKATVIYSLEPFKFADITPGLKATLDNAGYTTTRYTYPTLDQLQLANGSGVFVWQTHSGIVSEKRNNVVRTRYAIVTGEPCSEALSAGKYKALRDSGKLFVAGLEQQATDGTISSQAVYAISDLYVSENMRFASNAFVGMDSCTSSAFRQAFIAAGAGSYVGWDRLSGTRSGDRFSLLIDRLVGENLELPISDPWERPFDIDVTQQWMFDKGYYIDGSPNGDAQMVFAYNAGNKSLILRPSIARVLIEANDPQYNKTKYLLEGTFGPDPGVGKREVRWGATPVEILDWRELEGIRIKIPATVPTGELQVIRGTRKSNKVPMTHWNLPFTYTLTGKGTLKYEVKGTIQIRGDLRGNRWEPQQTVNKLPVGFWQLPGSNATVSASGQYKPSQSTTISWSGGTGAVSGDPAPTTNGLGFQGQINLQTSKIEQMIAFCTATYTRREASTGNPPVVTNPPAAIDGFFFFSIPFNPTTFNIPAGSVNANQAIGNSEGVSATFKWDAATAINPPGPTTPRRPVW
jgi:hypothetical protein